VLILALDTTTRAGSAAVMRDDELLALVAGDAARTHGERLPGEIARALADAGVERRDLDLLVVASGPGAFTGLRIGLAAVQALAMVLGVPVVGISALDALAAAAAADLEEEDQAIAAWMDAQRGEVFASNYAAAIEETRIRPHPSGLATVGTPSRLLAELSGDATTWLFVGDGAARYRDQIHAAMGERARIGVKDVPLAPALARLGRERATRGEAGPPHALQPLYVRRPDAELERERRRAP
jgi:tRNA threonylcarbamoyladenosine biosynthesis protein TsaB